MFKQRYTEQHYIDCIFAAVAKKLSDYRGYQIDRIQEMLQWSPGDRYYQVEITAWDAAENRVSLIFELQVGPVERALAVLYWIPL